MPKREAFVIPQGLSFEHTSKGVTIENQGDIVIKGSLGMNVHKLISTDGNIHIEQPLTVNEIIALNGSVSSSSALEVSTIQAKVVESAHSLDIKNRIHVSKRLLVHGELKSPKVQCLGQLEVHGSVDCDELNVEGVAHIAQNVSAQSIHAQAALEINGDVHCEEFVHSGNKLTLGSLHANALQAENAHVTIQNALHVSTAKCTSLTASGSITAPTMQLTQTLHLENATIQSDVVLTKEFSTSGEVSGKILVLEAPTQEGGHRIKGCLELSDFTDLVPDIDQFLRSRGLERQDGQLSVTISSSDEASESVESDSENDSSIEENNALHVNLNAISSVQETSISEESSMFHEDVETILDDVEEVVEPARIAVPIIDNSIETSKVPEEVNIENTPMTVALTEIDENDSQAEEIILNTPETDHSSIEHESDLDTPVASEAIMSEEVTYDEDRQEQNAREDSEEPSEKEDTGTTSNSVKQETEVPSVNPQYEIIRQDIQALIENYDEKNYPEAINELIGYLETEEYLILRDELRQLWGDLLKHHQLEGSRIPHLATGAFTNLSKSLQKL